MVKTVTALLYFFCFITVMSVPALAQDQSAKKITVEDDIAKRVRGSSEKTLLAYLLKMMFWAGGRINIIPAACA